MKIKSYIIIILFLLCSCKLFRNNRSLTLPISIEPATKSFALIDCGNIQTTGLVLKKHRKEVVASVRNQYIMMLPPILQKKLFINSIIDTTLTAEEKNKLIKKDHTTIAKLSEKYPTSIILILTHCYGGFLRDQRIKNEEPHFTTYFDTEWLIIQSKTIHEKSVTTYQDFSGGTIGTGLHLRGPEYKSNQNDISETAKMNALQFSELLGY